MLTAALSTEQEENEAKGRTQMDTCVFGVGLGLVKADRVRVCGTEGTGVLSCRAARKEDVTGRVTLRRAGGMGMNAGYWRWSSRRHW